MKKYYFKLSLITSAFAMFMSGYAMAQPGANPIPAGTFQISEQGSNQKSLDSCGYAANHYLVTKMTAAENYYLNIGDGNTTSDGAYPARAQYYPAPNGQEINISGISFYAYIAGVLSTSTRTVTSIYEANSDSTFSTLLASDTIDVTGNTFDAYLPDIQFSSEFENPVTVNSAYIVTVETMSNDSLSLVSNSFTNSDGIGEHLGMSYYAWPSDNQYDGWFKHSAYYPSWDFDFVIMPIIKAEISNDLPFLVSEDTVCLGESIITDYTTQSPIFGDRFYSINHANSFENMGLLYGSDSVGSSVGTHTYPIAGNFDMIFVDTFELYGYFNTPTQCMIADTFEVVVLDTVITGDFSHIDALGGGNIFNPATATDSLWFQEWLFYEIDGVTIIESISDIETYYGHGVDAEFKVGMVIGHECATDTIFKNVQFTVGIEEYDLNNISVYPNPSKNGFFQLKNLSNNVEQIYVMNALGQTVFTTRPKGNVSQLDLSNQHQGIYFMTVLTESGDKTTRRLLITK